MRARKTKFVYPPLDVAASGFRLLILQPGTDSSAAVCCQVFSSSLDDHPPYEALSYVWGDAKTTKFIAIRIAQSHEVQATETAPSFPLAVTVNLEHALRSLRYGDQPRTLWVDAICIDQGNIDERSQQVRLMGRIYRQCVRDLLWLGVDDPQITRAMNRIQRLQGQSEHTREQLRTSALGYETVTFSGFSDQDWDDLELLIDRNTVWRRVWILQELILAPQILLICGKCAMEWDCLSAIFENNVEYRDAMDLRRPVSMRIVKAFRASTTINTYRLPKSVTNGIFDKTLPSVVLFFLPLSATDRRDKVYALLNLTDEGSNFPVSYKKTEDQIAIDFATACIKFQGSLNILAHSRVSDNDIFKYLPPDPGSTHPSSEDRTSNLSLSNLAKTLRGIYKKKHRLPTWVPDLFKMTSSVSGLSTPGASRYNACGTYSCNPFNISPKLRLTVQGIFIDTISVLHTVSPIQPGETARQRWVRDVLSWAPPNLSCLTTYAWSSRHGESNINAYWCTITTDRRLDKRLGPADFNHVNWYLEIREGREVPEELLVLAGWRFGLTAERFYCMFPPQAEKGDVVAILYGAQVPLLLRRCAGEEDLFELIGEAYVHGLMDGEAPSYADRGLWDERGICQNRSFVIV